MSFLFPFPPLCTGFFGGAAEGAADAAAALVLADAEGAAEESAEGAAAAAEAWGAAGGAEGACGAAGTSGAGGGGAAAADGFEGTSLNQATAPMVAMTSAAATMASAEEARRARRPALVARAEEVCTAGLRAPGAPLPLIEAGSGSGCWGVAPRATIVASMRSARMAAEGMRLSRSCAIVALTSSCTCLGRLGATVASGGGSFTAMSIMRAL